MRYRVGKIGRCVVLQFEHGENILQGLTDVARREQIRAAVFYMVGGVKQAKIVVGPEKEEFPPRPVWRSITESHEVLGIGTIFWEGEEPRVHLHGAYGKRDSVKVGCLREFAESFIVLETILLEIEGVQARRELDPLTQMVLLNLK